MQINQLNLNTLKQLNTMKKILFASLVMGSIFSCSDDDSNGNGVYDENDEYECNETICTFEEWTSSAEGYFSIDKNGDVQILHMMEWKDYNESKKR